MGVRECNALSDRDAESVRILIEIFVDGACEPVNPGGIATYGFVIYQNGERVEASSGVVEKEDTSNNIAEYMAAICVLKKLVRHGVQNERVIVRSDSELLINQLNGLYAVRARRIAPLYGELNRLIAQLRSFGVAFQFTWISRELNQEADMLSKRAYEEYCTKHPSTLQRYAEYLATEKQKQFMRRLGIPFPKWISKREASKLIGEKLKEIRE